MSLAYGHKKILLGLIIRRVRPTMAELVVGPLLSMVKNKACNYLMDQFKVMQGMEKQRKILERKLPAILDIIQDAEEKGGFRPGVAAWLKDLRTVAYEANDVFDEFNYEALRRQAKKKGHHSTRFWDSNCKIFRCPPNLTNFGNFGNFGLVFS